MSEEMKLVQTLLDMARARVLAYDKLRNELGPPMLNDDAKAKANRKAVLDGLAEAQRTARDFEQQKARLIDEAAHQEAREAEEARQFWFRRFHTSLAIAHGAAFAAVGSNLFDKDTPPAVIHAAWHPMLLFAVGMVIAGALPMALYARKENLAWKLAGASAAFFVAGLGACLIAMWLRAEMVWPWQA